MFNRKNSEQSQLISAVKRCPLFDNLSGSELKGLLRIAHTRDYSAEEKVFEEGTVGLCFYILVKGSVAIVSTYEGKQTILKEYGDGAYFSEVHLFSETHHSVSCIAKEVTRLVVLSKPDFEDLVKINPKLGIKVLLKFLEFFGEKLDKLYKENSELKQNYPV